MSKELTILVLAGILSLELGCAGNLKINYINLPGGYKTTEKAFPILETIAGIYDGTIQLGFVKENGIITRKTITKRNYNLKKNPYSIERVARVADKNKNKIINYTEAKNLRKFIYDNLREFYFGDK